MVDVTTDTKKLDVINKYLITYLKRYSYEFRFLSDVVSENPVMPTANELDSDLDSISLDIDALLERHFSKELLEETPMFMSSEE